MERSYFQWRAANMTYVSIPGAPCVNTKKHVKQSWRGPHQLSRSPAKFAPSRRIAPIADIAPTSEAIEPAFYRVRQAQDEIRRFLPVIADLEIEAVWAGIIDTLPDVIPVMGHVNGVDGLLVATGFSGHGFGLGPMAGKVMAELAGGYSSSVDISGLSPAGSNNNRWVLNSAKPTQHNELSTTRRR